MTQSVNVRPGTVTAAQVIIWVLCAFSALGSALLLVLGIIGLVSGASVAASSAGSDASELGAGIGGLIGFFAGGLLVVGVISLVFVGLWFWIASALGRASRPARIVLTIFCAIDLLWGVVALVGSLADREGAPLLGGLLLLAIPATLMALVWGSEASRRFFDGVPSAYSPAPMSPPVGFVAPQGPMGHGPMAYGPMGQGPMGQGPMGPMSPPAGMGHPPFVPPQPGQYGPGRPGFGQQQHPEGVTTPIRVTARCRTCRSELPAGATQCGGCGASVQPQRPVGA